MLHLQGTSVDTTIILLCIVLVLLCFFLQRFVAKKLSYWIEEIPFVGKFFGTWLQSRLFDTLITQLLCPSVETPQCS